jgi:hypothetical protein
MAQKKQKNLIEFLNENWGWLIGVIATLFYVAPFSNREYYVNGDGLYFMWSGLVQSENLFGFTKHLAWPEGFSNWQYPQLGAGYLLIGTLASLIAGSNSASVIFGLSVVIISMINGIAVKFLLSSIDNNNPYLRNCLTFSFTFSPFLISNSHHLTIAAFYPLVLSFYLYTYLSENANLESFSWREYISFLIIFTGIPWWQGTLTLIFLAVALAALLVKSWNQLKVSFVIALVNFLGFLLQSLPSFLFFDSNSLATREGWDSNYLGGRFTDFLFASPFFNRIFPEFAERIQPGTSVEFNYSGVLGALGFAVLITTLLTGKLQKYSQLGFVVLLFFTLGGFGNVQAAFAEILGVKTPLRTWSRLVIAITLVGIMMLFVKLQKKKILGVLTGTLIGLVTTLDVFSINQPWEHDLREEKTVIRELKQNTDGNCPVLQLPRNSWPNPYLDKQGKTDETMYSSAIFYILDNSFYWTYGKWTLESDSSIDLNLKWVKKAMESENPLKDLSRTYCAILVDDAILENNTLQNQAKDIELARYIKTLPNVKSGNRYSLLILKQSEVKRNFSD